MLDLFSRVASQFPTVFEALNKGFLSTLALFAVTLIGAIPLGLIICLLSPSKMFFHHNEYPTNVLFFSSY